VIFLRVLCIDHYKVTKNISRDGGINDSFSGHLKQKIKLFSFRRNGYCWN